MHFSRLRVLEEVWNPQRGTVEGLTLRAKDVEILKTLEYRAWTHLILLGDL